MESKEASPKRSHAAVPDAGVFKNLFSCFRLGRSGLPDDVEPEVGDTAPTQIEPTLEICLQCCNVFLYRGTAGEDPRLCQRCNTKVAGGEGGDSFEYCDGCGPMEGNLTKMSNEESFESLILCDTCGKGFPSRSLGEADVYECLDCSLQSALSAKEPTSAFDLATSIVRKEAQDRKSKSPDDHCAAANCKGPTRYRVHCNACPRTFHTRCAGLPDCEFVYFRCDGCRRERNEEIAPWRRPEGLVFRKSHPPPPILCYICNGRVLLDLGPRYVEPGTRYRCLRCVSGREIML